MTKKVFGENENRVVHKARMIEHVLTVISSLDLAMCASVTNVAAAIAAKVALLSLSLLTNSQSVVSNGSRDSNFLMRHFVRIAYTSLNSGVRFTCTSIIWAVFLGHKLIS